MNHFSRRYQGVARVLATSFLVVGLLSPVHAHTSSPESTQPGPDLPQATLNAQASTNVEQDTITITLVAEVSDARRDKVNTELSRTLESVSKEAKGHAGITVSTRNYRIWPFSDDKGKISSWRGRAELVLESTDFDATSALAAQLSDRMPIGQLTFSVSPEVRTKHEEALLAEAVDAFRSRAQALTDALGYGAYSIRTVDLSGAGTYYQPAPRIMMAMAAEKASVPIDAGTELVTVSVNGSIYLLSKTEARPQQPSE